MALSGVDIMQDENTYKSTKQIFEEIAAVWNQMSDVSQAALAERLGGKRNMNVVMSIIQNIRDLKGAYQDSTTAAGTAQEANEIYMDSISGKIGQFKAQWDVFSNTALDSNMVKPFISGATQVLAVLTNIISVLKELGPLVTVPLGVKAAQGLYKLAQDLSGLDSVVGILAKKFVGLGDGVKTGLSKLKSSSIVGMIKNMMAVSPGVVVAAGGAVVAGAALLGVAAYEAYETSFTGKFNKFKEKLEKSSNLQQEASSYDSQIESNKSRLDALTELKNSTAGLTAAESEELAALQKQTAELIRQKDIKEGMAEVAKADVAKSAYEALTTNRWTTEAPVSGSQDHYLIRSKPLGESIEEQTKKYKANIKAREEASKKMQELTKQGKANSAQFITWQQRYQELDKKIPELGNNLSKDILTATQLADGLDRSTDAGSKLGAQIDEYINNAWRALNEASGKTPYQVIEDSISAGLFSEADSGLSTLATLGKVNAKTVDTFRSKYEDFNKALRDNGVTSKEVATHYNELGKSSLKIGGATDSAGRVLGYYSDQLQTVETNLGMLDQASTKLAQGEFSATDLATLQKSFSDIADGVNITSGNFEGLTENIEEARAHVGDFLVEQLEDLKNKAPTDKAKKQIDEVKKAVRELGDAAEETSNAYGGLGSVIEDANNRAKGTAAVVDQAESNAAYSIDVSAIKKMKEYREAGMVGLGNVKYWQIAAELFDGGYDNVTFENVEKKRKKLDQQYKKWYAAFDDVDTDGKLTHAGAEKFLNIISEDEKVVDRMAALGDSIKQNEDGGWDIDVDYSHLKMLAKEAGLTEDALRDLFVQVSMFGDLNWNQNGPANALSLLDESAWEYKSGKVDLSYEEAKSAASQLGISVTEYANSISDLLGREVKLVDSEGKQISKKKVERDKRIAEHSDRRQSGTPKTDKDAPVDNWQTSSYKTSETKGATKKGKRLVDNWQSSGYKPDEQKINFKADATSVDKVISDATKKAEAGMPTLKMDVDSSKADKKIDNTKKKASKPPAKVEVDADTKKAEGKIEIVKHKGAEKNTNRHQGQQKTTKVGKGVAAGVSKAFSKLSVGKSKANDKSSTVSVNADVSQADASVNALIRKITGQTYTMRVNTDSGGQAQVKPTLSTGSASKAASGFANQLASTIKDHSVTISANVQGTKDVEGLKKAEDTVKDKRVEVKANAKGKQGVDSLRGSINSTKGKKVSVNANTSGKGSVDSLRSSVNSLQSKTITITTVVRRVVQNVASTVSSSIGKAFGKAAGKLGGAGINGTAFARGTWGAKRSGRALGGELGQELIVRGNRFFTIGDAGAEFFNYRKGDVIFNAAQTEEIFRKGKLRGSDTRAHAYKDGNAFISGSVSFGGNGSSGYSSSSSTEKKKKTSSSSRSSSSSSSKKSSSRKSSGSSRKSTKRKSGGSKRKKRKSKSKKTKKKGSKSEKEYFDWIEVLIARIERKITNLGKVADSTFRSFGKRNKALKKEMSLVTKEIGKQEKGYKRYIKQANKVGLSKKYKKLVQDGAIDIDAIKDEKLKKKINEYREFYEKALSCKDAIVELKEKESELIKQRFDNVAKSYELTINRINSVSESLEAYIDLATTKGHQNNRLYYEALMEYDKKERKKLTEQRKALVSELNKAVKSGKIKKGSETWYEMQSQIDDLTTSIINCNKELEEHKNKIREIEWERADFNHASMTTFADEATFLAGLVDENDLFNEKGKITSKGKMVQGLHAQNYNTYMRDADAYVKDIADIDKKLAKDKYNKDLIDRRNELVAAQQKSIEAAQQEKTALQDLARKGVNALLDSLKKLIDKYNESLSSQKDLYDYQKKMKEKSENVSSLQKQLDAYAGDTSEESRQKIQKLRKDLAEAREDLQDTQYDKYISDTKELLDNFYTDYEEELNKRVDDIDGVLRESIEAANNNADKIARTIKAVAADVGYTRSDAMKSSWHTDTGTNGKVVDIYNSAVFYKEGTSTNKALRKEQDYANAVYWTDKQYDEERKNIEKLTGKVPGAITTTPPRIPKTITTTPPSKKKKDKKMLMKVGSVVSGSNGKFTIGGFASGVKNLGYDQFAWTQEYAPEVIIRRSDNALLTPLKRGDSVLNRAATSNLWDMANNPAEFMMSYLRLPSLPVGESSGNNKYDIDLDIVLPNVSNYEEFMNSARSDPKFEKLIQAMTVDRLAKKSAKAKNSIKW